jgi:small subunit ribosomal protein S10e
MQFLSCVLYVCFSCFRYLTNEGIQYLRDYLHLPPEIVPSTLKRQQRPDARPSAGGERRGFGGDRRDKPQDGDRAAYRRAPGADGADKTGAAGPGSAPMEFVSDLYFELC